MSPFRPDLCLRNKNGGAAQRVRNLVYNERFHYGNIPASFLCVSIGWAVELIVINFAHSELCS